ncbi:MAG: hypothetical protein NTZ83_02850 [Candidatus Pacearchaeota archaeon]|nr:hypothetical protein [Candidatus Pacearchaeota archaeon]
MKKRKGEITTQQIVLLIILILSFIVILFLLFRLNPGKNSEAEVCHNSVVMRGTSLPNAATPLKCSRTYVCLSKDGSCERMTKPEIKKVSTKDEIYNVLAEEMADCWWMFGEGKVDYVGKDFFKKDNYCSICSQIGFDDSIKEIDGIGEVISKDELYTYLSKTPMEPGGINYAEYFFRTNDINRLRAQTVKGEDGTEIVAGTFGTIDLNKQHFVLVGITSEIAGRGWRVVAGIGIVAAGFFAPPLWATWAGGIIGLLVGGAGEVAQGIEPEIAAIIVEGDGIENNFMAPTIQEANANSLKKLNCYDVITST